MCAYGPNVLGYNDPDVDAAAMKQNGGRWIYRREQILPREAV